MAEILGWPTDGAADLPPTFLDAGGQPIRPNVTPEELELTEDQKMFLPRDERTGGGNWGQRNWGRISAWAAKPGDEMADAMFKEFAEIKEHMGIGLRRWAYNYTVTANNIAETVADKLGLPYEAKKNFLVAWSNRLREMNIEPTSDEVEDQLVYMLFNIAPDIVPIVLGGGVVSASVSWGARAANISQRTATIAGMFGKVAGDASVNAMQFMAHEAGQAELEGRQADYAQAGKDGIVMGTAMSLIGRSTRAIGLKRRYSAITTGATMGGISAVYGDSNDPAYGDTNAAMTILGTLFGVAVPGTARTGIKDLVTWSSARKQQGLASGPKEWMQEFLPDTYEKVFIDDVIKDKAKYSAKHGAPRDLSPRDAFLKPLANIVGKELHGLQDNQLVNVMMDHMNQINLSTEFVDAAGRKIPGVNSISNAKDAQIILRAIGEAQKVFMKDHPDYVSRWGESEFPLRYNHRTDLKEIKQIKGKETTKIAEITKGKEKGKQLASHELSWTEYASIFGNTPANKNAHYNSLLEAGKTYIEANKATWPNKGGLIEHGLDNEYGFIHRKPTKLKDRPPEKSAQEAASHLREKHRKESAELTEAYKEAGEFKAGIIERAYRLLVDPSGRFLSFLEKVPEGVMLPVRNALNLRYTKSVKIQNAIDEVKEVVRWDDMPEAGVGSKADLDIILREEAETDMGLRSGADPSKPRSTNLRQEDRIDAIEYMKREHESSPGSRKLLEDRISYIQDTFARLFEELAENGIIPRETYNRLKHLRWIPFKTIESAFNEIKLHMEGRNPEKIGPSIHKPLLKDMLTTSKKAKVVDTELLLNRWIAVVKNTIADNQLLKEMANTQDKSGGLWYTKGNKPGKSGEKFKREYQVNEYLEDGQVKKIWIDKTINNSIRSLDTQRSVFTGTPANIARWLSGTAFVQLSAVALNPVFAVVTHPLDFGMIMNAHKDLSPFVPTNFKQFYIKSGQVGRGWAPFVKNVVSVLKQDDVYKKYIKEDGVIQTLVSHFQQVEGIKRATDIYSTNSLKVRTGDKLFKTLEFIGKFGHAMEVGTRMTEADLLMSLKNKDGTPRFTQKQANHESLRRLNYGRQGEIMQFVGTIIPFANAQAQILSNVAHTLTTPKGAIQVASITSQLVGGLVLYRYLMEQLFPGYMKDVPWEQRMRYWVIPTGANTMYMNEPESYYFKIKMAYNPIFTLINGFVQASLDRYFYGEKDMVPYTAWQTTYESLKVAMPLDLQSVMPPAIKVAMAAGYNMDIDGKEFYKGPDRELVDEINKEGQAGITTEQLAIDTARLIGFSPARLQAMTDSVIADNPFLWWGHLPFSEDKTVQQSILDKAVEAAPLRKIMGTTNKNWRTYETGQIDRNKAGSLNYHTIDSKLDKPILKLQQDIISIPQFKKEVTKLIQETEPSDQFKMVMRMNQEVKAKALLNTFLKNPHYKTDTYAEYKQDLYGELQPMVYWKVLRSINNPKIRAENYLAEYEQVDDKWKQRFKDLAVAYGFFNNGFFSREVQKLNPKQTVYK